MRLWKVVEFVRFSNSSFCFFMPKAASSDGWTGLNAISYYFGVVEGPPKQIKAIYADLLSRGSRQARRPDCSSREWADLYLPETRIVCGTAMLPHVEHHLYCCKCCAKLDDRVVHRLSFFLFVI